MGPIKVPAPVLYARKLCNLVAEKNELELETGPEKEPIRISESFTSYNQNQNGAPLYFIWTWSKLELDDRYCIVIIMNIIIG